MIEKVVAQDASPHPDQFYNTLLQMIGFVQMMIMWLLYKLMFALEILFSPNTFITEYLTPAKGNPNPLHELWKHSRDIVNIILASILVVGAVITIVTANGDILKNNIKKFMIAIILVNFSWWFPRVIIDTASVLTATIYSLPAALNVECKPLKGDTSCFIWEDPQFDLSSIEAAEKIGDGYIPSSDDLHYKKVPLARNANTPPAILLGLLFNNLRVFDLGKMPDFPDTDNENVPFGTAGVSEQVRIVIYALFSVIILAAVFFPLLAMLVAFTVRIPIIWLTVAFMPFMFLGLIIGNKMGEFNTMNVIWKKFLGAAFLPAIVGIPIAVGFILLNTGMRTIQLPKYEEAGRFLGVFDMNNFMDLLWLAMSLGVLWIGTFAALKSANIASGVVDTIKNYGQTLGKGMAKLPLRIPFIPAIGGKPGGFLSAGAAYQKVKDTLDPRKVVYNELSKEYPGEATGLGGGALADRVLNEPALRAIRSDIDIRISNDFNSVNNFTGKDFDTYAKENVDKLTNAIKNVKDIAAKMKEADPNIIINEKTVTEFANKLGANYNEEVVKKLLAK